MKHLSELLKEKCQIEKKYRSTSTTASVKKELIDWYDVAKEKTDEKSDFYCVLPKTLMIENLNIRQKIMQVRK